MTRRIAVVGVAAVGVALLMLSLAWGLEHAALSNPPVLGKPAPQLTIQPPYGENAVSIAALKGKPVVLNFWASWCGPCAEESGVLSGGAAAHPSVAFVGADNRDTPAAFRWFEVQHPHGYPVGPIVQGTYQAYGVSALPATFFIDQTGVVVASFTGPLSTDLLAHYVNLITS